MIIPCYFKCYNLHIMINYSVYIYSALIYIIYVICISYRISNDLFINWNKMLVWNLLHSRASSLVFFSIFTTIYIINLRVFYSDHTLYLYIYNTVTSFFRVENCETFGVYKSERVCGIVSPSVLVTLPPSSSRWLNDILTNRAVLWCQLLTPPHPNSLKNHPSRSTGFCCLRCDQL